MGPPLTAILASFIRRRGVRRREGLETAHRPAKLLELYSFEGCPFCRVAREALNELDLDYVHRTAPKGNDARRAEVRGLVGLAQFPVLVDPNTAVTMAESADIVRYLERTYGPGTRPAP
jgi:glutathione S-transferase